MKRFFGILLLIGAAIGAWLSVRGIFWQERAVTEFATAEAVVNSSEVRISRGRRSTTYRAIIKYTYTVDGKPYDSDQVYPYSYSSSSESAAHSLAMRFAPGRQVTAYYDPDKPTDAILIREYMADPYFLSLGTLFLTLLGAAMTLNLGGRRKEMGAVALDDSGWKLLLPTVNLRKQFWSSLIWTAGWGIMAVPVMSHWLARVGWERVSTYFMAIPSAIFFIVLLVVLFRRWNVSRTISDARLRLNPVPMRLGEVCAVSAEMDAFSPLRVAQMTASVVCVEHYKEKSGNKVQIGSRTRGEKVLQLSGPVQVPTGQVLEGTAEVFLGKEDWPPTSNATERKQYPHWMWEVRVDVKLEGAIDYHGVFPLDVV